MKQQPDVKGGKIMSRKYKWLLSIMMLAVMVIAMAAACGSKKEEAAEPEKKEEKKVEAEKEVEAEPEKVTDDHQQPNDEITDYGLTEAQIQDLYDTIESVMVTEYIEPNSIQKFQWPDDEEFWNICQGFFTEYETFVGMQTIDLENTEMELTEDQKQMFSAMKENEPTVEQIPTTEENKAIITSMYTAIKKWTEKNSIDFDRFSFMVFPWHKELVNNTFIE